MIISDGERNGWIKVMSASRCFARVGFNNPRDFDTRDQVYKNIHPFKHSSILIDFICKSTKQDESKTTQRIWLMKLQIHIVETAYNLHCLHTEYFLFRKYNSVVE